MPDPSRQDGDRPGGLTSPAVQTPTSLLLRYRLDDQHSPGDWPQGMQLATLAPDLMPAVHALLVLGYRDGHGVVPDLQTWQDALLNDAEYDPQLCFIALDAQGVVAVLQGWTSAFIKDLVVHPRARRQGLAHALMLLAFDAYRQRGEGWVDLRVIADNGPARRLYESLGMQVVEERPAVYWR